MPFVEHSGRRILFVHIPKTGGTTVEDWLRTLGPLRLFHFGHPEALRCTPQHLTMRDLEALLGKDFFDYAFAIVRNPYERIASEYRMHAALARERFFPGLPDFPLWLESNLREAARDACHLDNHLRPQWAFLGEGVEILRYEDGLRECVKTVAERIGAAPPMRLGRRYATGGGAGGAKVRFGLPEIARMRDAYGRDFEFFGYDPEPPAALDARAG